MTSKASRRGSIIMLATLLMVVASVYLTTALFDVRGAIDQERLYKTKKQLYYLQIAIADYRTNNIARPLQSFDELISQQTQNSCNLQYSSAFTTMQIPKEWCGPYIDTSLFLGSPTAYKEDAWGTALQLSSGGSAGAYTYSIKSCGEDTICGGSNSADDLEVSF